MRHTALLARTGVAGVVIGLLGLITPILFASAAGAVTHNVSVVEFSFSPAALTVQAGETVVWTNNGTIAHTVTADNGSFNSGSLSPGQSFSHTFSAAGAVPYHCLFHGAAGGVGMAARVTVQSAAPVTNAPPPATVPVPTTLAATPGPASPVTVAPPAPATNATVAGAATTTAEPQLARTGANGLAVAVFAFLLIAAGLLTIVSSRRRARAVVRVPNRDR
jgi:plastocyanin